MWLSVQDAKINIQLVKGFASGLTLYILYGLRFVPGVLVKAIMQMATNVSRLAVRAGF
jgi:hypothetical protein